MAPANTCHFYYNTPYGPITVESRGNKVCFIGTGRLVRNTTYAATPQSNACATEILQYLCGRRKSFSIDGGQEGSQFQQLVWNEVRKIPYGKHCTASDIAQRIGHPKSHKAVGAALRANKLAILVPTHRVTTTAGKPWGIGKDANIRAALLHFEEQQLKAGN